MERSDFLDADWDIARGRLPVDQLSDAFNWTRKVAEFAARLGYTRTFLTGHSLGGALVQVVAANFGGVIGATYNAPGMKGATASGPNQFSNKNLRIYNIRLHCDLVSVKGTHIGQPVITVRNGSMSPVGNHKVGTLLRAILSEPGIAPKEVDSLV